MDAAYISTLAALSGSAIGALASFATSWTIQNAQIKKTQLLQDRARREAIYGEFIQEASSLFADAFVHGLDDPGKLVRLYAIVNTTRLYGEPRTLDEAEKVMKRIGATYFAPSRELREFANITRAGELDPLCDFSRACRDELQRVRI